MWIFGTILKSRPIKAAHCLTSIQTSLSIYTVLEVYRVSDMELVSALPSAEDEVNVACFHPLAGGGLVYGTKEGKIRILQYNGGHAPRPDHFFEARAVESSRRSHTFKFKEIADHSNQCEQFTLDIFLDRNGSAGMRQMEWVHGGRQSMVDESE
ncbi:hypothetical protein Lser_V15G02851 [Lactuca serriola]